MSNQNEKSQYQHIGEVSHPFFEGLLDGASEIIFCENQRTYVFADNAPVPVDHEDAQGQLHQLLEDLDADVYNDFVNADRATAHIFEFTSEGTSYLGVYFYEAGKVCALFRKDPENYVESDRDFRLADVS